MKAIYRITNTETGETHWTLKRGLEETINQIEGRERVRFMDRQAINSRDALLPDYQSYIENHLSDFLSDSIEIDKYTTEFELIDALK